MDEPELFLLDFGGLPGADERRAEDARQREESRRRYLALVEAAVIAAATTDSMTMATAVLDALVDHRHADGSECRCSCHPRLPTSDLHDYGFDCPCTHTVERRRASIDKWRESMDAFWSSPEGMAKQAATEAEEAELAVWLADHPDVVVRSHGGWAPEQWNGSVNGHSFYFRERHDDWRIELDLRPTGHFIKALRGVAADGDYVTEPYELSEGDVIAEGTTAIAGYGATPVERIEFIAATITTHLAREACLVHRSGLDDLARRLGEEPSWCPACGARLPGPQ